MERIRIEVIDRRYAAILAAKTPAEREQRHREYLRRLLGDGAARYLASRGSKRFEPPLKVPYIVVGSIASIVYGESRFTQDIDIIAAFER